MVVKVNVKWCMMGNAIFKFNSGHGALLCSGCDIIIREGEDLTRLDLRCIKDDYSVGAQYCEKCKDVKNKQILTDEEWIELTTEWCKQYDGGKHQRAGQAYMNALFKVNKSLYNKITETEDDCFYDDNLIIKFIRRLND